MKLICSKSNLLNGVNIVSKAVPTRTTLVILECILIDCTSGNIKLVANDMELGIETTVEGEVTEKGMIAIDAKIFSDIVRKLPDNEIEITTDDKFNINISCGKSIYNIYGKDGSDFSFLPEIEKNQTIYMSQFSLKEIIRQTIFSISYNDTNKLMTGEYFEVTGNTLKVVSLDGHRIAIREINLKEEFDDLKVIIPGKTLIEISKILSGGTDDEIKLFFTKNHIVFEFDNTTVVSRLIEGEYFKIDKMLSSDYETKVTVNKKNFYDCIERVSLFVDVDKKPIILSVNNENMKLNNNSSIGLAEDDIEIEKEGKDIKIGFNPKFLLDALKVIDDENITVHFVNSKAPCFIKNEEEGYIYIILPVSFNV